MVRARRTLALLALGRQDLESATFLLHDYAARSRGRSDQGVLVKSLRMFALLSDSEQFRAEAISEMEALGDEEGVRRAREGSEPLHAFEGMGPWSQALQAALLDPSTLRGLPI